MLPKINIFIDRISHNAKTLKNRLKSIEIMGITKGVCGDTEIAKAMIESGIELLGDSRISNIVRMRREGIKEKIFQIRSPQISEIRSTVKYADGAFITELKIARAISRQAKLMNKKFELIMMVELGDLREGVMPDETLDFALTLKKDGIALSGIGTNLGCFGGVVPTEEKLLELLKVKEKLEKSGIEINVVSGGATDTIHLFEKNGIQGITQLRIGEAILIGHDTTGNRNIDYLRQDTFTIEAEVIELREKPSLPYGIIGRDAFGNTPVHRDRGMRKRAILALGKQDVEFDQLIPLDKGVEILGGSSDHMVVDVTEAEKKYEVGGSMLFYPLYPSLLKFMCSRDSNKEYIKGQ